MKSTLLILMGVLLAVCLVCCNSTNRKKDSTDTKAQGPIELTDDDFKERFEKGKEYHSNPFANAAKFKRDTSIVPFEIINGDEVQSPSEIPWQVALIKKNQDPYWGQFCGGSLINDRWVLTAAHCLENLTTDSLQIMIGTIDLSYPGIISDIKRIIIHPDYNSNTIDNDIALLELVTPIPLNQNSNIIELPRDDANEQLLTPGRTVTVSGWGVTEDGYSASILNKVEIEMVSESDCVSSYGSYITINMICAGFQQGGKDACQGDSGGPLFTLDQNDIPKLVGIVSWGQGCAEPDLYGVYTKVHNYMDWINNECSCLSDTINPII